MKLQASLERQHFFYIDFIARFFLPSVYLELPQIKFLISIPVVTIPSPLFMHYKKRRMEWSPSKLYPLTPNTDTIYFPKVLRLLILRTIRQEML